MSEGIGTKIVYAIIDDICHSLGGGDEWRRKFKDAQSRDKDLSMVYPQFQMWMLTNTSHGVILFAQDKKRQDIITSCSHLFSKWPVIDINKAVTIEAVATKESINLSNTMNAEWSPDDYDLSAVLSAGFSARAAACFSIALTEATCAEAVSSALSAVQAAARASGDRGHYTIMADKLIELIKSV